MTIHLTKNQIRQECLMFRKTLSTKIIAEASQKIIQHIQTIPTYQTAKHIAWYHPTKGEVDLTFLWQTALKASKSCYLPSIQNNNTLVFFPFTMDTPLSTNRYGIVEPNPSDQNTNDIATLDLIFLPIVAFDSTLTRLGMGAGYYDRTLAHYPHIPIIGVAYEWQHQPYIPKDSWDITPDFIVTEQKIYSQ